MYSALSSANRAASTKFQTSRQPSPCRVNCAWASGVLYRVYVPSPFGLNISGPWVPGFHADRLMRTFTVPLLSVSRSVPSVNCTQREGMGAATFGGSFSFVGTKSAKAAGLVSVYSNEESEASSSGSLSLICWQIFASAHAVILSIICTMVTMLHLLSCTALAEGYLSDAHVLAPVVHDILTAVDVDALASFSARRKILDIRKEQQA